MSSFLLTDSFGTFFNIQLVFNFILVLKKTSVRIKHYKKVTENEVYEMKFDKEEYYSKLPNEFMM